MKPLWKCAECGENHQYEDDAAHCCRPPRPFQIWVCPHCSDEFRTSVEFDVHFAICDGEHIPTADELEAAGQKRLAI